MRSRLASLHAKTRCESVVATDEAAQRTSLNWKTLSKLFHIDSPRICNHDEIGVLRIEISTGACGPGRTLREDHCHNAGLPFSRMFIVGLCFLPFLLAETFKLQSSWFTVSVAYRLIKVDGIEHV